MQMGAEWFVLKNGVTIGPLDISHLQQLVAADQLLRSDCVRQPGSQTWQVAGSIPGLFDKTSHDSSGSSKAAPGDEPGHASIWWQLFGFWPVPIGLVLLFTPYWGWGIGVIIWGIAFGICFGLQGLHKSVDKRREFLVGAAGLFGIFAVREVGKFFIGRWKEGENLDQRKRHPAKGRSKA